MYFLLFRNANLNYQVHPYFFLRRMYEGRDEYFNLNKMIKDFISGGKVTFNFEGQQSKPGVKWPVSFAVHEILESPGKTLMERFSEVKEKKGVLLSIVYSFSDNKSSINITNDVINYHRWNCAPQDRVIENIHSYLEPKFNRFSLDWNGSKAELQKLPYSLLPLSEADRVMLVYGFGEVLMIGNDGLAFGLP